MTEIPLPVVEDSTALESRPVPTHPRFARLHAAEVPLVQSGSGAGPRAGTEGYSPLLVGLRTRGSPTHPGPLPRLHVPELAVLLARVPCPATLLQVYLHELEQASTASYVASHACCDDSVFLSRRTHWSLLAFSSKVIVRLATQATHSARTTVQVRVHTPREAAVRHMNLTIDAYPALEDQTRESGWQSA